MRRLPPRTLPTFVDAGANDILFLRLIARALPAGSPAERAVSSLGTRARRYVGDGAVAGRGEILVWSEGELT